MPANTTSNQDKIIDRAEGAPSLDELIEIIEYLDDKLTTALNRIEELESQINDSN